MSNRPGEARRWPEHLPVGAVRVARSSAHYHQMVRFYRDLVGLPVVEPTSPHPYWAANGGVTYQDPDGREVVFVSWVYGRDRT